MATAAIYYAPEGFDTGGEKLMGRHSAGEGFLKGFIHHASSDDIYAYTLNQKYFQDFTGKVQSWMGDKKKNLNCVLFESPIGLNKPGNVFYPSPGIGEFAWMRRHFGQKLFGITGITHTTASDSVMKCIADLLVAPVQSWDSIICTSSVVRKTIEHELEKHGEFLADRLGIPTTPKTDIMLPVIPLGVDTAAFATGAKQVEFREKWRKQLEVGDDDIVVLFMGRLSFHAKAHPFPMYLALEKAQRETKKKIHLVQAGWFANDHIANSFKNAAKQICPSVNCIFVDGRPKDVREQIWSAADIFCSLSDNIQETFGLTPIEAMAASLPLVVTDWDGYKDTVRDNQDGFRVPTYAPSAGNGIELAYRYEANVDNYDMYCANSSLCTAVDIEATTKAFVELINNPALRRKMGDSGRKRAEEVYDWKHIVKAYEELWGEQDNRRMLDAERAILKSGQPANPMRDDPFALFASYPTEALGDSMIIRLSMRSPEDAIKGVRQMAIGNYGNIFDPEIIAKMVNLVGNNPNTTVSGIKKIFEETKHSKVEHNILWLMKFGIFSKA